MDTIYKKDEDEDKDEGMTLDSKASTSDQPNTCLVIGSDDEMETTEKHLEDYYKAKIDHNYPNSHIIRKTVKE